jgi:uncharacterized membrane protein
MFRAIPADGNPPLYFLLARFCLRLPIRTEIALRLPSIVAINVAAVMIYIFVRRKADRIFAFFAVSIFLGSFLGRYGAVEARPYSLVVCFTGIAIFCWQSADNVGKRRYALAGVVLSTVGAILSHQYGAIYVAVPLLAGEGIRTLQRRSFDAPMFAAILVGNAQFLSPSPQ